MNCFAGLFGDLRKGSLPLIQIAEIQLGRDWDSPVIPDLKQSGLTGGTSAIHHRQKELIQHVTSQLQPRTANIILPVQVLVSEGFRLPSKPAHELCLKTQ